ncbi:MAG: LLM class flavin-dependent oxidoreductase [Acidocella sp.]|uniref:LLM class flavin-dependent oxidoreductase n=1 Tax=Acidocella sp. TaxID=50710 RepID=UPI003FBE52FE
MADKEKKQLHVNLFEMNCVSHIIHGLWVHPDNNRHRFNDIEFWTELAQLLEYGTFDGIFLADVVGAYDQYRGGPETALREALQIPNNDPFFIIPAMAQVAKNLGFGATSSTTYEPPFSFARRLSTLDHITKGRVGWNIVTSYLPNQAANYGLDAEMPHDERYRIANEYLDVLYKLWEGSWEEDAVIQDLEHRVYTDPSKVHYINHSGPHFRVKGPHLSQPSRQRTPVLFQATGSNAGKEFAGRHAEVVFTGGGSPEAVRANVADMRARAARYGRNPQNIKFLAGAGIIVGKDADEVSAKFDNYKRYISAEARLAHSQSRIDYTAFPETVTIGELKKREVSGYEFIPPRYRDEQTVGEILAELRSVNYGRFFVAGTPDIVADRIEEWLDVDDIDGINLVQYLTPGTARDFIELVVPELRRRGRFRETYNPGETLRERLLGAGNARLLSEHYGAQFRDPANFGKATEPLAIPEQNNDAGLELSHHEFRERAAADSAAE